MDKVKNKSGIYQIINIVNNKRYIGSSNNLLARKKQHFVTLKQNKHHCIYLQNAYNKYGKENFKFEIIFYCDVSEIIYYEQMGLDSYDKKELYNICFIAGRTEGIKWREESRIKLSEARNGIIFSDDHIENLRISHTGYIMPEEQRQKIGIANSGENAPHYGKHGKNHHSSKPVYQLDKITGEIIKEWESAVDAGKAYNSIHVGTACISERNKSLKGYRWCYVEDYHKEKDKDYTDRRAVRGKNNSKSKAVYQMDKDTGEIIKKWDSLADIRRELKISPSNVIQVCKGTRLNCNGFKWSYVNENKIKGE